MSPGGASEPVRELRARSGGSPRTEGPRQADAPASEPCLHCGHPVRIRLMGCKGGHCPNCRHPYPHGDCSD